MSAAGGMDGSGRHYDEVSDGETFRRSITVTDAHLVIGAGLIGDFNPHHVDDNYARTRASARASCTACSPAR
jgi:acyl dehydratase